MTKVVVRSGPGLTQEITAGLNSLVSDEPVAAGGGGEGPDPYSLLLAALGACTSMTLELYAQRKGWPLEDVVVELHHSRVYAADCEHCEDPRAFVDHVALRIVVRGALDGAQVARLRDIARKCPVHKTLVAGIKVDDEIALAAP